MVGAIAGCDDTVVLVVGWCCGGNNDDDGLNCWIGGLMVE